MDSKVPSINFCNENLKPGTEEWESTKNQVVKALKEYRCFEAIYDKIPNEIEEDLFNTLKEIFPLESKVREYIGKPFSDYNEKLLRPPYNDMRRTVDLLLPHSVDTFVDTFWPQGNPHYSNVMKTYAKSLMELDEILKRMILEGLGLKNYIDEFLDQNIYSVRIINYKKAPEEESKPRLPSHTDTGYLTILKQNQNGLQVQMNNGEWIEPQCLSHNSFLVFAGDSFMAWTNGQIKSALHKVTLPEEIDRVSLTLFASPKPGYKVVAPKEVVDEEHPILFKPYDIVDYNTYRMTKADYRNPEPLKAYCGA